MVKISKHEDNFLCIESVLNEVCLSEKEQNELLDYLLEKTNNGKLEKIIIDVKYELMKAQIHFDLFHSEHEGFAILLEEIDELWEGVKMKQSNPLRKTICKKEAIQVCAMALRFLYDLT